MIKICIHYNYRTVQFQTATSGMNIYIQLPSITLQLRLWSFYCHHKGSSKLQSVINVLVRGPLVILNIRVFDTLGNSFLPIYLRRISNLCGHSPAVFIVVFLSRMRVNCKKLSRYRRDRTTAGEPYRTQPLRYRSFNFTTEPI